MTAPDDMALARALNDHAAGTPLAAAAQAARRLSARLTDPVRIAVAGGPGTGKSALRAFLAPGDGCALAEIPLETDTPIDVQGIDIIVFCGHDFGADERRLWNALHPAQRDHAIFALTGADGLAGAGHLQDSLAALDAAAGDLMLGLFPIATPQAISARRAGDAAALRASGGAALLQAVDRLVAEGRAAARDAARLFLTRHAPPMQARLSATPDQRPFASQQWQAAQTLLATELAGWADLARLATQDRPRAILDRACALARALADLAPTALPDPITEEAATVVDMVHLMRAEGGAGAATDALTLLAQLRASIACAAGQGG